MSGAGTEPIVAGFDRHGNWHIPGGEGGGQFAKPGWSSAKSLAIRAVRGLFAANTVRDGDPDGTWLEAADDYLSRLGIAKGHAVRVRWGDDTHGLIDAVHPDGKTRPVKVKWERFADHLPDVGVGRVDVPTVARNTTKADTGRGQTTAARIRDAGGTGLAVVADGYLARHGHPKGATVTVTRVDDTYADVHPATPDGRKVRSKWSHFSDDAPELDAPDAANAPGGTAELLRAPAGYVLEPDDRFEAWDGNPTPPEMLAVTPEREAAIRAATWHHGTTNPNWRDGDHWVHVGTRAAAEDRVAHPDDPAGRAEVYDVRLKPDARISPVMWEDNGEIRWSPPSDDPNHPLDYIPGGPYDVVPYWNVEEDPGSMSLWARADALEPVTPRSADSPLLAEAKEAWTDDLSMEITYAAASVLGLGPNDGWSNSSEAEYDGWARALVEGVNNSPRVDHPLYHGTAGTARVAAVGESMVVPLMATSRSLDSAHEWRTNGGYDAPGGGVIYRFDNAPGLEMAPRLDDQAAGEWLVSGRFTVTGVDTADDGSPIVALRYDGPVNSPNPDTRRTSFGGPPPYRKERWESGETAHFEYHCLESDESCDANLWRHSHQPVTVLHETDSYDRLDDLEGIESTYADRADAAMPRMYRVRFADGLEYDATEDELYVDPAGWERPDPPARRQAVDPERPYLSEPPVELHPSPALDPDRLTDQAILRWLAVPGLKLSSGDAMELHSAKLTWLHEEAIRRGWTRDQASAAVLAIDSALDESSDTMVWDRGRLTDAVANVDAGRVDSDLDRGVVLQRAYTDAVWQAVYGDAPTIELSRVFASGDTYRSTPGPQVDGVASWVVRDNEQQVVDWFATRDLTPEVARGDAERDRVLMLPWGEGRYRSDYVRIKGEVLVAAGPKGRPPRDVLLDPDADPVDVARAVYEGRTPGGHRVAVTAATANDYTGGPSHAPVTRRVIRITGDVYDDNGAAHRFGQQITVSPGVDGDPFVNVFLEGGGDLWRDLDRYTVDTVAARIGADRVASMSPYGAADTRAFIEDGWAFHPNTDRALVRFLGQDLSYDHRDNPVVAAWKNWDQRDLADIPPPQALLDPANAEIRSDGLNRISYLGVRDLTGRKPVPELPREGGYVEWVDAENLPDGTVVEVANPDTDETVTVVITAGASFSFLDTYRGDRRIIGADGRYPSQVKVVRYASAPLPTPPEPPEPYPGVSVRSKTLVPAMPLLYPGKIIEGETGLSKLPGGVRYRKVNDLNEPFKGAAEFDMVVEAVGGLVRPAHDSRPSSAQRLTGFVGGRYMLTVVPDRLGRNDGTEPPEAFQQAVRNGIIAAARDRGVTISKVAPLAVGAVNPADWVDDDYPEVRPVAKLLQAGATDWRFDRFGERTNELGERYPAMTGHEAVGPVWRVPGPGINDVMFSTVPIDGAEPETLSAHQVQGALRTDHGWVLWAKNIGPVPWRDPQPTPLTEAAVAERIDRLRSPSQPADTTIGFLDDSDSGPVTPGRLARWLDPTFNAERTPAGHPFIRPASPVGTGSRWYGPIRAVRFTRNAHNDPIIEAIPQPIGSPEMDLAGWDPTGDDLILPINDPRLPDAIEAAWWDNADRRGVVRQATRALAVGAPRGTILGAATSRDTTRDQRRIVVDALMNRDVRLRLANTDPDGQVRVVWRNNRFEVDPDGTPLDGTNDITFMWSDGDTVVAALTPDAIGAVRGPAAAAPDYTPVYDDRPWDERVAHLATQRDRLLARTGGTQIDDMFYAADDLLETRLWDPAKLTRRDQAQIGKVEAVVEHGRAVQRLVAERMAAIRSDASRDGTYIDRTSGTAPAPAKPVPAKQAKALTKTLNELDDLGLLYDHDRTDIAAALDDLRTRAATGDVHVALRPPPRKLSPRVTDPRDVLRSVVITRTGTAVNRARGPQIHMWFAADGRVAYVTVYPVEAATYDRADLTTTDVDTAKVGRRMLKLAEQIGLISKADPRPTIAELAFLETLEALGGDAGTNPEIRVGKANGSGPTNAATVAIGRSDGPEAYAAKIGLNPFPRSWTSTVVGRTQHFQFSEADKYKSGQGHNLGGGDRIKIADPRKYPRHRDTVVHEIGHTMERTVPGLTDAEAWYLAWRLRRSAPGSKPERRGEIDGVPIWTYPIDFANGYSGRVYNRERIAGNGSYEVFTTAMEQILNMGSPTSRGGTDDDLYAFAAGLLALIEARTAKEAAK